ncbi:hypothetical protein BT63DRAFT_419341 [Microthyrium microscopicum]|uniref:Uncharacterized protein n=1 Tax=Microthyrium microscopicum TaxID=703497 RepID=A0A6A6URI8_9PEZI|nr:hypothetical protein BT63DRAFT_419341 [Microthyrium microscopicum]
MASPPHSPMTLVPGMDLDTDDPIIPPSSHTLAKTGYFLEKRADWDLWFDHIKRHASILGVWEYIDPDADTPVPPKLPNIPSDDHPNLKDAVLLYKARLNEFITVRDILNQVYQLITHSIHKHFQEGIYDTKDCRTMLRELREWNQDCDGAVEEDLRDELERLKKGPFPTQSIREWLVDWQKFARQSRRYIGKSYPWTDWAICQDLCEAAKSSNEVFAGCGRDKIDEMDKKEVFSLNDFLKYYVKLYDNTFPYVNLSQESHL